MMRVVLLVVHTFLGVSALAAGMALARKPDGSSLQLEHEWLGGSPFPDYRIPGLFLGTVIAGANLVSALAQLKRDDRAPAVSFSTGLLLVVWIAIQTVIIGLRHWTQFMWWALFVSVALVGAGQLRGIRPDRPSG